PATSFYLLSLHDALPIFGCGHDAYLSDEIVRMMKEISGKIPLILKVDESDVQGPLRIRVRSFLETIAMKKEQGVLHTAKPLGEPDRKSTRLNSSHVSIAY